MAWVKFTAFIKKYWQLLIGFLVAAGVFIWSLLDRRKRNAVLQNAVEAADKAQQAEQDFNTQVSIATTNANQQHEDRVDDAKKTQDEEIAAAKKDVQDRTKENQNASNEYLAEKIGNTLGVNVVLPDQDSEDD
jgi:F0F1-type ATP synthase membrane subunit b/b'